MSKTPNVAKKALEHFREEAKESSTEKLDVDFLGNEINVGDKVIFEAPKYRDFVIGKVISKSPKTCQVEFLNTLNNSKGFIDVFRQFYGQLIKLPEPVIEAEWIDQYEGKYANSLYECSHCKRKAPLEVKANELGNEHIEQVLSLFCPNCGAKMKGVTLNESKFENYI